MNPLFFYLPVSDSVPTSSTLSESLCENPAIAHDQAYIAAHAASLDDELFIYDRAPLPGEWPEAVPEGAVVRVFVINAWSTVRVLQTAHGKRIGEPVIDCWRTAAPLAVAA